MVGQRGLVHKKARLVIVNLQATPLDPLAKLRINAKTDDVMKRLMEKLQLPIPPFKLRRYACVHYDVAVPAGVIEKKTEAKGQKPTNQAVISTVISSCDSDGTPYTLFTKVGSSLRLPSGIHDAPPVVNPQQNAEFSFAVPANEVDLAGQDAKQADNPVKAPELTYELHFAGHYGEPPVQVTLRVINKSADHRLVLEYDPLTREWAWHDSAAIKSANGAGV